MQKKVLLSLLACMVALGSVWGQSRTITGKVTATADGSALPGVNVLVKGTSTGAVTDNGGQYAIQVDGNATLVFSFIGFIPQEIAAGNRATIDVQLTEDIKELGEVVVTALGVEREKRALGFSVTELQSEAITNTRQTNVVNSLTAKVAGLRVQGTNGMVGSGSAVFIRGFTTFTGNNQPLFVVDGIPVDNNNVPVARGDVSGNATQNGVSNSNRAVDLNPDDIESVSVLKGPAAAVLYGSRAASGAILITTKKGKMGAKSTVNFTSNYNVVQVNRFPDWQNEYAQGTGGVFNPSSNFSWGPRIEGQTVTNYLGEEEQLRAYPNNVRDIFRTGSNFQNSISFSGGTEKTAFILSYSNLSESGILKNNELDRNTFRVNASTQISKRLNVGGSITYVNNRSDRTQQGNQLSAPFFRTWFLPRSYNLQGYPVETSTGAQSFYDASDNPLWSIERIKYSDAQNRFLGYATLQYSFTDWLNLDYRIGTDAYNLNINTFDPAGARGQANHSVQGAGAVGNRTIYYQETSSYLNLRANKSITDDFSLSLLVGNEINAQNSRNEGVVGVGVVVPGFQQISNTLTPNPFSTITQTRLIGAYGQADLGFRNYLFLTLTGRNDWSSTFGTNNRSYFYPSTALSFVFTDAFTALKGNNILSYGKIRANIARVGRIAPAYSTETYFSSPDAGSAPFISDGFGPLIAFPFRGQPGRTLGSFNSNAINIDGNPELGPEFTVTREVGMELRFLNNRISLEADYFSTKSTDIILEVPVAAASGAATELLNAGELKSEGIEALLNVTPVKTNAFRWDVSANFTRIRNTVVSLAPGVTNLNIGGFTGNGPTIRLTAGQPYGAIYGVKFRRDEDGNLLIRQTGTAGATTGPGTVIPNTDSIQNVGDANPLWTAGITNTFSYKGLVLSFLLDIKQGGIIASRNVGDLRRSGAVAETADRDRTYIIPGVLANPTDLTKPALGADGQPIRNDIEISAEQYWGSQYAFGTLENYVFDGSWVRLREVSLNYSLPSSLINKTPFGNIEVGVTGRNLLLWTKVPHIDPEANLNGAGNAQGLEWNALPQTRTYGVLLRVTL